MWPRESNLWRLFSQLSKHAHVVLRSKSGKTSQRVCVYYSTSRAAFKTMGAVGTKQCGRRSRLAPAGGFSAISPKVAGLKFNPSTAILWLNFPMHQTGDKVEAACGG